MPIPEATNVYIDSAIKAGFSNPMSSSTINTATFVVSTGGVKVTGTVSYNAGAQTAFFSPNLPLGAFASYTVTLTTGIKDTTGNPLTASYTWLFTAGGGSAPARLYVGDPGAAEIVVFNNANSADGNLTPDRTIGSGSFTWPWHIWFDKGADRLYAANDTNNILVFKNVSLLNGSVTPSRTISGTLFTQSAGIWVDTTHDVLYISDNSAGAIEVFNNASTLNGTVTPDRIIWGSNTGLSSPENIWLDQATDQLYVADGGAVAILVFTGASTAIGNVAPSRTITSADFTDPTSLWLDTSSDQLYIGNYGGSSVLVLNSAHTINGSVTPDRIIAGPNTTFITPYGLWLDVSNDRLYVADFINNAIDVFNGASTINGDSAPSRVIVGSNTGFNYPESVVLDLNP
jgi:sugar lactone lactonase YvrE